MNKLHIGSEASDSYQKAIIHLEIEVSADETEETIEKWRPILNSKAAKMADELATFVKLNEKMKRRGK